jgi:uncharacterized membrane protein YczE
VPLDDRRDLARRVGRCLAGVVLFGVGIALTVQADLGLAPWDVLHQGLSERTGIPMGTVAIGVGLLVLLLWIPLRQRVGVGTLLNVLVVGLVLDAMLVVLPEPGQLVTRWAFLLGGLVLVATATGLYIGSGLGPGPRDGLMVGLKERGVKVHLARTAIEVGALALGWVLGGTVGLGTVVSALLIGPMVHVALPPLMLPPLTRRPEAAA